MADCEMCGKTVGKLISAKIEGTTMKVCPDCARYGQTLSSPSERRTNFSTARPKRVYVNPDENKFVVKNYSQLVKNARESRKLKQEQVAKQLNEKESLIHSVESGHLKPSFKTARKLEKFFNIKLIEEVPSGMPEKIETQSEEAEPLTMGDLLKKAMKK